MLSPDLYPCRIVSSSESDERQLLTQSRSRRPTRLGSACGPTPSTGRRLVPGTDSGDPGGWSVAEGRWDQDEALAIRWNGDRVPEAENQGRNDALKIVLDAFRSFAQMEDELKMDRSCSEIADDMCKRVKYEVREKQRSQIGPAGDPRDNLQNYWDGMADVVRPFYQMLKEKPLPNPSFNT